MTNKNSVAWHFGQPAPPLLPELSKRMRLDAKKRNEARKRLISGVFEILSPAPPKKQKHDCMASKKSVEKAQQKRKRAADDDGGD